MALKNNFADRLIAEIEKKKNPSVVGLDTSFAKIPDFFKKDFMGSYELAFQSAARAVYEFNKKIIDELKGIYKGQCQLCGTFAGKEIGADITEAHHIEYFSKTQNNDASNIIVLCPNSSAYFSNNVFLGFSESTRLAVNT